MEQSDVGTRVPLDIDTAHVPLGEVFILPERCKGCDFCIAFCPTEVLIRSTEINSKGYHFAVVAPGKEHACIHCEFCDLICPEIAIYTRRVIATGEGENDAPS